MKSEDSCSTACVKHYPVLLFFLYRQESYWAVISDVQGGLYSFRWKKALSWFKDRAKTFMSRLYGSAESYLNCAWKWYSACASLDSIHKLSRQFLSLLLTQDLDKSFLKGPAKDNVIWSLVFVDSVKQMAVENNLGLKEYKVILD